MEEHRPSPLTPELLIFFISVALYGLAMGMSDNIISNFFKDAYDVNSVQRGFLEFPRELPGILCFIIIALTSALGDVRLAIISQLLCAAGLLVLGLFTPSFGIMALLIFIKSIGMHLYLPLLDSIAITIIGKQNVGKRMGQISAVRTACMMLASVLVFIGFRSGLFSFKTPLKLPFIISAVGFIGVSALLAILLVTYKVYGETRKKHFNIIIKKEYTIFYILAVLTGVHRQIMIVFGPWVLIEILSRQSDTLAFLQIIAFFLGIFLLPSIGRWIDRFGPKKILVAEGLLFIVIYTLYGYISSGFAGGTLPLTGIPVFIVFALYIVDRLAMQFGMVRAVYLKSIVRDPSDLTPTLSTGLSMDHVVTVFFAYLGGLVWFRFGPQSVFYASAALSIVNVIAALMIKPVVGANIMAQNT